MTNFCQVLAIFSAEAMTIAAITTGMPAYRCPVARAQTRAHREASDG